jgi:hypothetical protein
MNLDAKILNTCKLNSTTYQKYQAPHEKAGSTKPQDKKKQDSRE